ncbi:hypothetical protein [Pontibacter litorisediminis]|uniref:hypothetical protein n=1 Tax=Pontibacter litorisediminis TaxID=1846260 RepID=UPI0023ED3562|nr:hypothetical protein [Pontibacter litorisediminis]
MKAAGTFETRFPVDSYSIIPKTLVVAALIFAFSESWWLTIAGGVPAGLLLHFIPNGYDCKVLLNGSMLSFYFFRPWFRKEAFDLTKIDKAVVEPENAAQTLKDIWWRSDMLWPVGNSKLKLFRNGHLVHTVDFRTNPEDTRKLAELISLQFPSELQTVHP